MKALRRTDIVLVVLGIFTVTISLTNIMHFYDQVGNDGCGCSLSTYKEGKRANKHTIKAEPEDDRTESIGGIAQVAQAPKIPRIIWQTYKTKPLPEGMPRKIQNSWKSLNPEWEIKLLDDNDVDNYVESHYPKYASTFRSLPLAVLKADMWRLMVMANEGGIYADADVQCKKPIEEWLPADCEVMLGLDWLFDDFFANFLLVAIPGHPLLHHVVDVIMNKTIALGDGIVKDEHMVHDTTGPAALTEAVLSFMGIDIDIHAGTSESERPIRLTSLMRDTSLYQVARLRHGICLSGKMFLGEVVMNLGGSQHGAYLKAGWTDWRKERIHLGEKTTKKRWFKNLQG